MSLKNFPRVASGGSATLSGAQSAQLSEAATKADAITPDAGATIASGNNAFLLGKLWVNNGAAFTVPATPTLTNLRAGLSEIPQTVIDEVVLSASTDLTGAAPAGAKTGIRLDTGVEFIVSGGNWVVKPVVMDGNQRHFPIVRTTAVLTAPTTAEITAANGGVAHTLVRGDTARVVNSAGEAINFTYEASAWGAGMAEPFSPSAAPLWQPSRDYVAGEIFGIDHAIALAVDANGDRVNIGRQVMTYATDRTSGAVLDLAEIALMEIVGAGISDSLFYASNQVGQSIAAFFGTSVRGNNTTSQITVARWLSENRARVTKTSVGAAVSVADMITGVNAALTTQSLPNVTDFRWFKEPIITGPVATTPLASTEIIPAGVYEITYNQVGAVVNLVFRRQDTVATSASYLTAIRDADTAEDTNAPSELAVRNALDAIGVPTLRLAAGGTPAPNGIYVQAVGDTHVAPVLTAGQRTTVVNLQSGGGTIETTYLHDGVAQSASVVGAATPNEVVSSTTALSGTAPAGARFGYDSSTNTLYTVVGGSWQAIPVLSPSDIQFAAKAPDAANKTQTIWVDVSAARWPVYRRALASDAWPTEPTGYVFEVAVANGTVKDVTDRVKDGRAWTPEIISDVLRGNDESRFKHWATGTIDFNALHTGANTKAIRLFSFSAAVNLSNPPQDGAALGVVGHGYYVGDADNGHQFVYFLKDSIGRETEYYRERSGGAWTAWAAVSSDGWQGSSNDMQISSGMHVVVADGHKVHFLSTDRARAIRLIPDSDWSKVGAITPGGSWTFDGDFPTSGRQEVVLVPAPVANVWNVSAVLAGSGKPSYIKRATNTTGSAPTEVEYPSPADGDVVIVKLGNDTIEVWSHDGTDWAVGSAIISNPAVIPTVQAGLGDPIKIDDYGRPSHFHLNSASGAVSWAVGSAPDGVWHYVTNTGTVAANVTFSGQAGIFLRDGTATNEIAGGVLATQPGDAYLVHVTNNAGNRYVNIAKFGGGAAGETPSDLPVFVGTANGIDGASGYALTTSVNTIGATNNGAAGIALPVGRYRISLTGQKSINSGEHRSSIFNKAGQRLGEFYCTANRAESASFDYQVTASDDFIRIQRDYSSGNGNVDNVILTIARTSGAFIIPSDSALLQARAITGSATGTGYDGVPVPVQIELQAGQLLDTVTGTGGAVVENINPITGTCTVTVNGAATTLSHTTVGTPITVTAPLIQTANAGVAVNFGTISVQMSSAGNRSMQIRSNTGGVINIRASAVWNGSVGSQAIRTMALNNTTFQSIETGWNSTTAGDNMTALIHDQTNNRWYEVRMVTGSAYMNNVFDIRETSSFFMAPAGAVVRTPCSVSVNGAEAVTLFGGTSARVMATVPAGQALTSATGSAGITVAISDAETGALEVSVAEGTTSGTVTTTQATLTGPTYTTSESSTGQFWTDGKVIYRKTFTGTTPNNANDNSLFTLPTGASFLRMEGYVQQSGNSRRVNADQVQSGNGAHGPMFQYYSSDNSVHGYNATGDTRWQNMAYAISVYYTK